MLCESHDKVIPQGCEKREVLFARSPGGHNWNFWLTHTQTPHDGAATATVIYGGISSGSITRWIFTPVIVQSESPAVIV